MGSVLDHRLVSAPSQGHIDGRPGKFVVLHVGLPVHAQTDAQGHCHLIADIDGLYLLKDGKTILPERLHVFLLDGKKVLVLLNLLYHPVQTGNVLADLSVDEGRQKGTAHLLHALQCLVVVVQIDQAADHLLVVDLLLILEHAGLVKQIDRNHFLLGFVQLQFLLLIRLHVHIHRTQIHPEFPVLIGDVNTALLP